MKDPDNLDYAEAMLKAAVAGDYRKTADWLANLLFQANSAEAIIQGFFAGLLLTLEG